MGNPPGSDRDLGVGQERQRGGERTQDMATNAGKRRGVQSERRRLAGGGFGRRPGGWRSVPGKEVGRGCDRDVRKQWPLLLGGR